jgi:outer membrane immunogenic protein
MLAGPAMAADMPVAPPPPPPVYYDWSGAYLGFNAGGVWYDVDRNFPVAAPPPFPTDRGFSTSGSDGIYVFHAGLQWQWGIWVLGVEAALSGCFNECRSFTSESITGGDVGPGLVSAEHKITNLFTVGPRLGYAWDRWMIFATGGWASANLKGAYCRTITGRCDGPDSFGNGASRNSGWYAGGGFDWMVHKGPLVDVILGVEYQHFDVGGESAFCVNPGCGVANFRDYDESAKGDLVRARLTIKTAGYGYFWR